MAFSLNRAQIIGNMTREPEVKQTPQGQFVATFGVATNMTWTDNNGQKQEKVEFHNVVAWRKLAEIIKQYCHKGMKIYVEGRMQTRDWEGEDGVKRYRTEIVAENIIMLTPKGNAMSMSGGGLTQERQPGGIGEISEPTAPSAGASIGGVMGEDDLSVEDLPF